MKLFVCEFDILVFLFLDSVPLFCFIVTTPNFSFKLHYIKRSQFSDLYRRIDSYFFTSCFASLRKQALQVDLVWERPKMLVSNYMLSNEDWDWPGLRYMPPERPGTDSVNRCPLKTFRQPRRLLTMIHSLCQPGSPNVDKEYILPCS